MPAPREALVERVRSIWRRPARDVHDELEFHLQMRAEEAKRSGLSEDAARAAALERFGQLESIEGELMQMETARSRRRDRAEWIDEVERDVRFALRTLRRTPGFTAASVSTLAIAIGATTAIFSIVYAMLLAPLPYADADRLVVPWGAGLGELTALRERWRPAASMAAVRQTELNVDDGTSAERLSGAAVSDSFFNVLGVPPLFGRTFSPNENARGETGVIVLSEGFWRRRFGADSTVLGKSILTDGVPRKIVGIMPKRFAFPAENVSFWIPTLMDRANPKGMWTTVGFTFVARLRTGVTLEGARADITRLAPQLRPLNPVWDPGEAYGTNATLLPLRDAIVGETRTVLRLVMGCALLVLLIACINVANLLLARASARSRELSVRAALGGGRDRLIRQLLTESVVLSGAGAVVGVALAAASIRWLVTVIPGEVPGGADISINAPALFLALALAVGTGLAFGALPALRATKPHATDGLVRSPRGSRGVGHQRISSMLIAGEIALAVLVVTSAALLVRSFRELRNVDPGFQPGGVVAMRVTPNVAVYGDPARADAFFAALLERTSAIPGMQSVAISNGLPLAFPARGLGVRVEGSFEDGSQTLPWVNHLQNVSPDYFRTFNIPVRRGRGFTAADRRDAVPVAIVSERVAQALWPGQDPIGRRIGYPYESPWLTVVGVVPDVKSDNLRDTTVSAVYVPFLQRPLDPSGRARTDLIIVYKATREAMAAARTVQRYVTDIDRTVTTGRPQNMDDVLAKSVGSVRFTTALVSSFALVALLLGAIGIYGVMSYVVNQRAHELTIRAALGATSAELYRMVLGRAAGLALLGVLSGVGLALVATRALSALMFGVSTTDPVTLTVVPLIFVAVAVAAGASPARRASRTHPASVMRGE